MTKTQLEDLKNECDVLKQVTIKAYEDYLNRYGAKVIERNE